MIKKILFASAIFFTFSDYCFAALDQIEVIGLIPGVSTKAQVDDTDFVIGGYRLQCKSQFIDGVLCKLSCFTGKDNFSRDTTVDVLLYASNITIHNVLIRGFTKKYGKPASNINTPVQNRVGAKFNENTVIWKDKKGNILMLSSMLGSVDTGLFLLQSSQGIKKSELEQDATNNKRKF